jgi:hypothetical protein
MFGPNGVMHDRVLAPFSRQPVTRIQTGTTQCITEMRILYMAAKQGRNVLSRMRFSAGARTRGAYYQAQCYALRLPHRDQTSYSACQIGPSASYRFQCSALHRGHTLSCELALCLWALRGASIGREALDFLEQRHTMSVRWVPKRSYAWPPNRDQLSYSACLKGPNASDWIQ